MKATHMYAAGDARVEDVPDPVLHEPTRACICGSDLWPYRSQPFSDKGRRMGHAFIGVVEDVGSKVSGLGPAPYCESSGATIVRPCR